MRTGRPGGNRRWAAEPEAASVAFGDVHGEPARAYDRIDRRRRDQAARSPGR
jgi:hypothetical protein